MDWGQKHPRGTPGLLISTNLTTAGDKRQARMPSRRVPVARHEAQPIKRSLPQGDTQDRFTFISLAWYVRCPTLRSRPANAEAVALRPVQFARVADAPSRIAGYERSPKTLRQIPPLSSGGHSPR